MEVTAITALYCMEYRDINFRELNPPKNPSLTSNDLLSRVILIKIDIFFILLSLSQIFIAWRIFGYWMIYPTCEVIEISKKWRIWGDFQTLESGLFGAESIGRIIAGLSWGDSLGIAVDSWASLGSFRHD